MKNTDIKKLGCELQQNVWEAVTLVKMSTKISLKEMISELVTKYLYTYSKEKNVSQETLEMIEKKLKAVGEVYGDKYN